MPSPPSPEPGPALPAAACPPDRAAVVHRVCSMAAAVAIIMTANAMSSTAPGRTPPTTPPRAAPAMPAAPKTRPVRQRTRPARACIATETSDVVPTTSREPAIASFGSMPAT